MKYTVADIKRSYSREKKASEKKYHLIGHLIYRPISFYLTPIFLTVSLSANAVSLIGLFLCLLLPVVSIFGGAFAYLYMALLSFSCLILDYIDGNIARTTGKSQPLGRYLDSFSGTVYSVLLYASMGLLLEYGEGPGRFLDKGGIAIALLIALLNVFGRESRLYVKMYFADCAPQFISDGVSLKSTFFSALAGFGALDPFLIVVFGYFESLDILLVLFLLYSLSIFLYSQIRIFSSLYHLCATNTTEEENA